MSPLVAAVFAGLMKRATGQELAPSRRWRIEALLGPVLRARGLDTIDHLAARLHGGAQPPGDGLVEEVVEALLNHETSFFRDAGAFAQLAGEVLPALADLRARTRRLRIWSAGCSTGQEAYSLAIELARAPARWAGWTVAILGTDISAQAVARAREGRYGAFEIGRGLPGPDVPAYFDADGDGWRASPALRRRLEFARHNLLDPPPAGPFDLVLCRNVLLYFAPEQQRVVLDHLAHALSPDGFLMLGAGETVLGQSDAFAAAPGMRGLYRPVKAAR